MAFLNDGEAVIVEVADYAYVGARPEVFLNRARHRGIGGRVVHADHPSRDDERFELAEFLKGVPMPVGCIDEQVVNLTVPVQSEIVRLKESPLSLQSGGLDASGRKRARFDIHARQPATDLAEREEEGEGRIPVPCPEFQHPLPSCLNRDPVEGRKMPVDVGASRGQMLERRDRIRPQRFEEERLHLADSLQRVEMLPPQEEGLEGRDDAPA